MDEDWHLYFRESIPLCCTMYMDLELKEFFFLRLIYFLITLFLQYFFHYHLVPLYSHPQQSPHCFLCPWVLFPFCPIPPVPNLPPTLSCHPALYLWVCLILLKRIFNFKLPLGNTSFIMSVLQKLYCGYYDYYLLVYMIPKFHVKYEHCLWLI